jgi:integrase
VGGGLVVRVYPGGRKVLRWQLRTHNLAATLGEWTEHPAPGRITLADALAAVARLKAANKSGQLEGTLAEVSSPAPRRRPGELTVRGSVEQFIAYLQQERRRPEQAERLLRFDVLDPKVRPKVADLPLRSLTEQHVRALVERVVERGSPVTAQHLLALAKQWLRYAYDRGDIDRNPADRFRNPRALGARKAKPGRRYLAAEEIPPFWRALDALTPTIRNAVRILLLTGVRTGALLGARWEEVDLDAGLWTVPPARLKLTKAREEVAEPFRVPLAPAAVDQLRELRALADMLGSPWVLASPVKDDAPISEKAINHAVRALFTGEPPLTLPGGRARPHDLRRTLRTHVEQTLGYPEALCERILGHARGDQVDTYSAGDDLDRRREALTAWADLVLRLARGGDGKVVPITKAVRS